MQVNKLYTILDTLTNLIKMSPPKNNASLGRFCFHFRPDYGIFQRTLFFTFSISLCCSCGELAIVEKKKIPFYFESTYIDIIDHTFTDTSNPEIIKLICKTNFPKGTVIVCNTGNFMESTTVEKNKHKADTITINQNTFEFLISSASISGYANFRVFKHLQTDSIMQIIGIDGDNILFKDKALALQKQAYCSCLFDSEYILEYEKNKEIKRENSFAKDGLNKLVIKKFK